MSAEERNVRPNEYGELTSKDYVPGAQVWSNSSIIRVRNYWEGFLEFS